MDSLGSNPAINFHCQLLLSSLLKLLKGHLKAVHANRLIPSSPLKVRVGTGGEEAEVSWKGMFKPPCSSYLPTGPASGNMGPDDQGWEEEAGRENRCHGQWLGPGREGKPGGGPGWSKRTMAADSHPRMHPQGRDRPA